MCVFVCVFVCVYVHGSACSTGVSIVQPLASYSTGEDGTQAMISLEVVHLDSQAANMTVLELTLFDTSEVSFAGITTTTPDSVSLSRSADGSVLTINCQLSTNVAVAIAGVDDLVDDGDIPFTIFIQTGVRLTSMSALGKDGDIINSLSFELIGINKDNDTAGTLSHHPLNKQSNKPTTTSNSYPTHIAVDHILCVM